MKTEARVLVTVLLAVLSFLISPDGEAQAAMGLDEVSSYTSEFFVAHLRLPQGSRIDYLRHYYYDTSPAVSQAWITRYNAQGTYDDLASVYSEGEAGYGSVLSAYVGEIINNTQYAYALLWRVGDLGHRMRLCGMRVAYRLPDGLGGFGPFQYRFVPGVAFLPRNGDVPWSYSHKGCISVPYEVYLPIVFKDL